MFCLKCGKELPDGTKFCGFCGTSQSVDKSVVRKSSIPDAGTGFEPAVTVIPESVIPESVIPEFVPEDAEISESAMIPESAFVNDGAVPPVTAIPESVIPEFAPSNENNANFAGGSADLSKNSDGGQNTYVNNENSAASDEANFAVNGESIAPFSLTTVTTLMGKLKKRLPLCIAAAVVIVVGIVGLNLAFNRAGMAHAFMGDKKYAASTMQKNLAEISEMSGGFAAAPSLSEYDSSSVELLLASLKSITPDNGATIELSVKSDFSDEALESAFYYDDDSALFTALNSVNGKFGIIFNDGSVSANAEILENGASLGSADALLNYGDETLYIRLPAEAYSNTLSKSVPVNADVLNELLNGGDDSMNDLLARISKAYTNALGDAEIEFGKADNGFSGKMITATFTNAAFGDLLEDVADAVDASNYGDYTDVSGILDYAKEIQSGDRKVTFTVTHYVNNNNSLAGYKWVYKEKGDYGVTASVSYLNDKKNGLSASLKIDDAEISVTQEPESKTEGKFKLTVKENDSSSKLSISYSNLGSTVFNGRTIPTGTFKVNLLDAKEAGILSGVSLGSLDFETLTVNISGSGNSVEFGVSLANKTENASIDFTVKCTEGFSGGEVSASDPVNLDSIDSASGNEIMSAILDYYIPIWSESGFASAVTVDGMALPDYLQIKYEKLNREEYLTRNYALYNENTRDDANNLAYSIYSDVYYSSDYSDNLPSGGVKTVKLYFDKSGAFSVIENSVLNTDALIKIRSENAKSAYIEILFERGRGNSGLCGVSVTMTDDPSNIPSSLPSVYNFLDGEYPWGDSDSINFIGAFAVGAYPALYNGSGGETEANDKALKERVSEYDGYAEAAYNAFNDFVSQKSIDLAEYANNNAVFFYLSNGSWKTYSSLGLSESDEAELAEYMQSQVPEFTDGYVFFNVNESGMVVGASVSNSSFSLSNPLYDIGETSDWSYLDGVWGSYVIGTYPKVTTFDGALSDNVIEKLTGTWVSGANTVTLTASDFENIAAIGTYSYRYMQVTLANGEVYRFDLNGSMVYDYGTYTKQ